MNAYMVQDKTINAIVNWLHREIPRLTYVSYKLKELGIDPALPGWEAKLGVALFELNTRAVESRYGRGQARSFRTLNYRYRPGFPAPLASVLKSLESWLYQCMEGQVVQTPLFKLFDCEVRIYLMKRIIETLPEYRQEVWD